MITIYALQCPDFMEQIDYFSLLTRVSVEKQKQIQGFRKSEDASRALWAALLLRALIRERTGLPNHRIRFDKNRYNKPFLTADISLHFNLSHSGGWIFCALDTEPVGVDIEHIQEITPGTVELRPALLFFYSLDLERKLFESQGHRSELPARRNCHRIESGPRDWYCLSF
jgi:phosphopantetheinyl transferase